jgi:hypothetical protein
MLDPCAQADAVSQLGDVAWNYSSFEAAHVVESSRRRVREYG